jgi:4-hydroxybenzoate polyprenyltransferase
MNQKEMYPPAWVRLLVIAVAFVALLVMMVVAAGGDIMPVLVFLAALVIIGIFFLAIWQAFEKHFPPPNRR